MDEWECLNCEKANEWKGSFGDDEICKYCGTVHETDWDYFGYDNMVSWIVKIKH